MVTICFSVGSGIGPETLRAVALSGLDDLLCGLVDQLVIIRLQANARFSVRLPLWNILLVCVPYIKIMFLTRYGEKLQLRRAYHANGHENNRALTPQCNDPVTIKKRKWFVPSALRRICRESRIYAGTLRFCRIPECLS